MTIHDEIDEETAPKPHRYADIACPQCGAEPTDESVRSVNLSDLGYKHADTQYECSECQYRWTHGVPIGSDDALADDLECNACDGWYLIHRVETTSNDAVKLHLKCPECHDFETTGRTLDSHNRALVGYPQITGELNTERPYGFNPDDVRGHNPEEGDVA